jgi:hypothetical protein
MARNLFAPKPFPIRDAFMTGRRNGKTINAPRIPEIGGMTTRNADKNESELVLKKLGKS